jgi:hypothetical protein
MRHKKIEEKLLLFLDNSLSESDRNSINAHLQNCESCSNKLNNLKSLWGQNIQKIHAPNDLWFRVQQSISQQKIRKASKKHMFIKPILQPVFYLALFIGAIFLGNRIAKTNEKSEKLNTTTSVLREFYIDRPEASSEKINELLFSLNDEGAKK